MKQQQTKTNITWTVDDDFCFPLFLHHRFFLLPSFLLFGNHAIYRLVGRRAVAPY